MQSKFSKREANDQRLQIAIPVSLKRQAFEIADREGISVGQFIRRAIAQAASTDHQAVAP